MKKKIALMATSLILVVAMAVGGTLAYLTSTTGTVENTFTVGNVNITLTEAPVDEHGQKVDGDRVTANSYKLYPGKTYHKDPTVFVGNTSEACWVFVKVVNGIAAIEGENTIASQMATAGNWTCIDPLNGIYAYKDALLGGQSATVFNQFTISDDVTDLAPYADAKITLVGYAIQAQGFDTAKDAWDAALYNGEVNPAV